MAARRTQFRVRAIRRMFERGITEEDVAHVLSTGEVIEEYPDDLPYPSRLDRRLDEEKRRRHENTVNS